MDLVGERVFGPYTVTRVIDDKGASAVLEAAVEGSPDDRLALRLLGPEASRDQVALSLANMEAVVVASLEHPHIAGVRGFGELDSGRPFLALELLKGEGLEARLARVRTLAPAAVCGLVEQAGGALQAVHDQGMIHGRLRPRYVFLCDDGKDGDVVKLLGFGVGRVADPLIPGPGSFLSPEVEAGEEPDATADVFSLGSIAYWALTGELAGADPRPVTELAPDVPGALDPVLQKAMAPQKEDRYPAVSELVQAFTEAVPAPVEDKPSSMFEEHATVMVDDAKLAAVPRPATGPVPPVRPTGPMPMVTLPPVEPRPARDSAIQPRRTAVAPPTGDDLPPLTIPPDRPDRASSVFDAVRIKSAEKDPEDETEEATDFISVDQLDPDDDDDDESEEPTLHAITVREFQEADTTESSFEAAATTETATEDFKGTVISPEAGEDDEPLSDKDTEDFKATTVAPPAEPKSSFDDAPTTMFEPVKLDED